jgi:hypothetical protein
MIEIDSVWINNDVLIAKFCCNLEKCKGICCCLKGARGAPIEESEAKILDSIFPIIKDEMNNASLEVVRNEGLYEGKNGDYYITCIGDEDCIFVYHDNNIAKCLLEKMYNEGKTNWKKPISCHLYPIRISNFGGDVARYSVIPECKDAVKFGNEKNVKLIDFLKEPLERHYGKDWYKKLKTELKKDSI